MCPSPISEESLEDVMITMVTTSNAFRFFFLDFSLIFDNDWIRIMELFITPNYYVR